jgi:hypothetical protein
MVKEHAAVLDLLKGQLIFFGLVAICSLLLFNPTLEIKGISYFSTSKVTLVPYLLGFVAAAWYGYKAALSLPEMPGRVWIRRAILAVSVGLLGVALTPYALATWIFAIHVTFAVMLFLAELALNAWLAFIAVKNIFNWVLYVLEFAGAIASALSLSFIHIINFMFLGQVVCQIAFVILLTRGIAVLCSQYDQEAATKAKPVPKSADAAGRADNSNSFFNGNS